MNTSKTVSIQLSFRKFLRRLEAILFLCKQLLSERNFIYLASVLIGTTIAFAVIVLKSFAHNVFVLANYTNSFLKFPFFNLLLPIIGIVLTVFVVRKFLNGSLEKGSSKVLYAVAKKGGIVPKKQMYAQIITSSLTVGLGGSAGLESPIVITGAAFGSNFAQKYRLTQKERILLLSCGVAAGIAAAFNAPIAGVLFAVEVILTDVGIAAFIPIIISAATGALVSNVVLSQDVLLNFKNVQAFNYHNTPYYVLLGILCGFVSVYHARTFRKVEHFFEKSSLGIYKKAFFGAGILAILIFVFPSLFGEGYESIKTLSASNPEILLNNTFLESYKSKSYVLLIFIGIIVLIKSIATGLTLGSGGNGGNFAPALFVGSYLGFFVSKIINLLGFGTQLPVANFAIVGMAGILAGLFHAPLTAIFLIGEITGGYDLMMPLMLVSSISFAVSKQFEFHSMDVKSLADKGEVFTSDKDKNIIQSIDFLHLVKTDAVTVLDNTTLNTVLNLFAKTNQPILPVLDSNNMLQGLISIDSIKKFALNPYSAKFTNLNEIIQPTEAIVRFDEYVENILQKFDDLNTNYLIVTKYNVFYGIVYKLDLLEEYRKRLQEMVIS
jgi:CIC family chloride channel protein